MADVVAWPPVTMMARESRPSRPGSTSYGMKGNAYYSQAQASRRLYSGQALVTGRDLAGLGYIDMLYDELDGKLALVRVTPNPALWTGATRGLLGFRGQQDMEWQEDGRTLIWDSGGLVWAEGAVISATAVMDGTFPAILCTGLPASRIVAFPGEIVRAETGETARVRKLERSDASGAARIRLNAVLPTGDVLIGARESLVFEITEWPDGMSSDRFDGRGQFRFRQAFETDFADGFTEIDPWS